MADEWGPNQQLLLWDLALRGGRALQKDVEYKEISKGRKDLERRKALTTSKVNRSFVLELTDNGWSELATRRSVLLKSKKKPSRERAILQLLLDALQNYAAKHEVGLAEILRPSPTASQRDEVRQKIRRAFFDIAGNPPQDSVRLSVLRATLREIPRQQIDEALLSMKKDHEINLMSLDNPRDIEAEETASLHDGRSQFHVLWIER
jgi:DNA primase